MKKQKTSMFSLVLFHVKETIANQFIKALLFYILLTYSVVDFCFLAQSSQLSVSGLDCIFFVFSGNLPYSMSAYKFSLPYIWLFVNCYIAIFVGDYTTAKNKFSRPNIIVSAGSKRIFWTSSCIAISLMILIVYVILYCICFILPFFLTNNMDFLFHSHLFLDILGISINHMECFKWVILFFPPAVSLASSLFQFSLAFATSPLISFIITITNHIIAAFFYSPVMFSNFSILVRNSQANFNGVSNLLAVVIIVIVINISYFSGFFWYSRKDVF